MRIVLTIAAVTSSFGFILAFLGTAALGITLVLFTALQILFVNSIIQKPIGASLGFDSPTPGLMKRKPRPADEKIMTLRLGTRLFIVGLIATLFSIIAYLWTRTTTGATTSAQTMAMVMLFHPGHTDFDRSPLPNGDDVPGRNLLQSTAVACLWLDPADSGAGYGDPVMAECVRN